VERPLPACTDLREARVLSHTTVAEASDHPLDKVLSLSFVLTDSAAGRPAADSSKPEPHDSDKSLRAVSADDKILAMDIGNILNAKGNAAAAAEARRRQQLAQATPMSNRSNSDMGSEQGSTSSGPQPLHPSNNQPNKYPSPIPTAPTMQMMPSGFLADNLQENGYPQTDDVNASRPASDQTTKSFACSHCNKGFARRSDLARHGEFDLSMCQLWC